MNEQFENMAKYLNQIQGGWPYRPEERANHLSFAAVEHHGRPVGIWLLWRGGTAAEAWAEGRKPASRWCHAWRRRRHGRRPQVRRRWTRNASKLQRRCRGRSGGRQPTEAEQQTEKQAAAGQGRRRAGGRPARTGPRPEPGRGAQEPQRNGLLLPPSALRRRRPGEARIHHARGPHQVEVPGLRPRRRNSAAAS